MRQLLSVVVVVVAIVFSVATSGHSSRASTGVPDYRARDFAPQIMAAADELGYQAYRFDSGDSIVHVDLGAGRYIYFRTFNGELERVVHLTDDNLTGPDREDAMFEAEEIGRSIWDRALQIRRELAL